MTSSFNILFFQCYSLRPFLFLDLISTIVSGFIFLCNSIFFLNLINLSIFTSRSDELEHSVALEMTVYIQNETAYTPLITFLRNMGYIGDQFILRKSFDILKVISFACFMFGCSTYPTIHGFVADVKFGLFVRCSFYNISLAMLRPVSWLQCIFCKHNNSIG